MNTSLPQQQPQIQKTTIADGSEPPAVPPQRVFRLQGSRSVGNWNAYWHFLYKGSDAQKEEWAATIPGVNRNANTTFSNSDMQAGYRSLNNEQRKRLEEKAEELDRAKMDPVVGTNARKAVARTYRRKLKALMSQMHAQLGWDAAIVFSSKFPEDHGKLTRAITNGNTATNALQRMKGGNDFVKKMMKEKRQGQLLKDQLLPRSMKFQTQKYLVQK
ncbi:hypothetical protein BJV82DRAFT_653979 [Fennellomyces sp. T-0311]|nr:hypothetical protein BJV82DRAFT_653979 [Fennellomyces sp. T-0311]